MRLIVFAILSFVVSSVHAQETDSYDDRAFYDDKGSGWSVGLSLGALLYDKLSYTTYYSSNRTEDIGPIINTGSFPISSVSPSFTISGQYHPETSNASFDTSIMYAKHEISEADDDIASLNKVALLAGGNYHFGDKSSSIRPYVSLDFGLSLNNIDWDEGSIPVRWAGGTTVDMNEDTTRADRADSFALGYKAQGDDDMPGEGGSSEHDIEIRDVDNWAASIVSQIGAGVDVKLGAVELGLLYNYLLTNRYDLNYGGTSTGDGGVLEYDTKFDAGALGGHKVEVKLNIPVEIFQNK